jgi:hypothetical protein
MQFSIVQDGGAKAHAEIKELKDSAGTVTGYEITLHCRN